MNVLEELLNNRWILKSREKEKYYLIRDNLEQVKKFITEKLGYRLIVNQYLIKMEKIPGAARPWMGITDFTDTMEYGFLCMVLMFLEDKEVEEQFVLSQLTEYIKGNYPGEIIDWTIFQHRRKIIKVIKFCMNQSLFFVNDGSEDDFASNFETEVLYENTGVSKYFMRNFAWDISNFTRAEDFFQSEWVDVDEDRGIIRRQRVYRKLLISPWVYKTEQNDEDFTYIRMYRNMVEGDFEAFFDCKLQIHKTSAYLIAGETANLGKVFPEGNSLSESAVFFHHMIREKVIEGVLKPGVEEYIQLSKTEFKALLAEGQKCFSDGLAKKYREMSEVEFGNALKNYLEEMDIISIDEITEDVMVYPTAGKVIGHYPVKELEKNNGGK